MSPRFPFFLCLAAGLAASPGARAMGAIVAVGPGTAVPVSLRLAVSGAQGRTSRWASMTVRGNAPGFAWLVPVRPGARVDLAPDAWLAALDAATAPRVVPPDVSPPCGAPGGAEVESDFTHTATAAPDAVGVAADRATLDAVLAPWGLALPAALGAELDAALAAGNGVVALHFAAGQGEVVTRTLRVVDDSAASLPLALLGGDGASLAITAFALAPGGASLSPARAVTLDPASLVWNGDGTSTYAAARDGVLAASPGAWLFETGGREELFLGGPVPGGAASPAIVAGYFDGAASALQATEAPAACTQRANGWSTSAALVAQACPAGALAQLGAVGCQETVGPGEIDPSQLRCGGIADDLAVALSGMAPRATWITRARAALGPAARGHDTGVGATSTAGPYGPVAVASAYASPCVADAGGAGPGPGVPAPGAPGVSVPPAAPVAAGAGGGALVSAAGDDASDPGSDPGAAAASVVGDTLSGSGGCGGSSSTSSDPGPDSSSSSSSCSGSTSSSSDGTDSSGCSGSSASSDSSGCSGSSDSSSSCRLGSRRSPVPRGLVLLIVAAALARRRGRRG